MPALSGGQGIGTAYTNYGLREHERSDEKSAQKKRLQLAYLGLGANALNSIAQTGTGIYNTVQHVQSAAARQQEAQKHESLLENLRLRQNEQQFGESHPPMNEGGAMVPLEAYRAKTARVEAERTPDVEYLAKAMGATRMGNAATLQESPEFLKLPLEEQRAAIMGEARGQPTEEGRRVSLLNNAAQLYGAKDSGAMISGVDTPDVQLRREAMAKLVASLLQKQAPPEMMDAVIAKLQTTAGGIPAAQEHAAPGVETSLRNLFLGGRPMWGTTPLPSVGMDAETKNRLIEQLLERARQGRRPGPLPPYPPLTEEERRNFAP